MISDVLSYLDYSRCAEIALILFVAAFAVIAVQTNLLKREESTRRSRIPIEDADRREKHV